jgi:hypothetical protein
VVKSGREDKVNKKILSPYMLLPRDTLRGICMRAQYSAREDGWLLAHAVYVLISEHFQPV